MARSSTADPDEFRLRHPDHEQRDDDGVYVTTDPVEAMALQTRGYELLSGDVAKAPARSSGSSSSSSSSGASSGTS